MDTNSPLALALRAGLIAGAAALVGVASPASAQQSPLLLVQSKDWSAVTAGAQKAKVCYAITKPTKMEPASLNHGEVFFFISIWPGDNVRNEPSLQVGYSLKEGSKVTVEVDTQKFSMFTRGDGAWLQDKTDEVKLVDALKKGKKLTIGGQSGRGNATTYAFSLQGFSGALDAALKECK
ncbi:invasion associated locus B family protein [Prosthecomicrobium hirschii]|uniref:invasion associated locus B family protein n=1 Tax=Prosthecodimorpha hirschii TaxID=665126 RepID=UPI001AEECACF|nr:invasion associated locus B family protein [Prosthecomicrobium hirschii]MCW1842840.1 invasion associated locus B family protein [Prosthecomicrobium hirschii]